LALLAAGFSAGAALFAAGVTFLGAALPKVGFFAASLERSATAAPAPVLDWRLALFFAAGFFALVTMGVSR
jgi:hypothetical protein